MIRKFAKVCAGILAGLTLTLSFASAAMAAEPVSIMEYQKGVGILFRAAVLPTPSFAATPYP